jgi:hypothetical protein
MQRHGRFIGLAGLGVQIRRGIQQRAGPVALEHAAGFEALRRALIMIVVMVMVVVLVVMRVVVMVMTVIMALIMAMIGIILRFGAGSAVILMAPGTAAPSTIAPTTTFTVASAIPAVVAALAVMVVIGVQRLLRLAHQRFAVGDRDPVIVGVDFAERQETVAVAAVLDEACLERRFDPRHLGEIDVSLERPATGNFDVEFLKLLSVHHRDPSLFRVGGIDQHCLGHA